MAARITFQGRDGRLRLLSGDTPPYYIEIPFVQMDLDAQSTARQRPLDPITPTVSSYTHAPVDSSYDASLYEPITLNFSYWINNKDHWAIRDALCNPDLKNPWTVGNNIWSTSKGKGSIIMPDLTFRKTVDFFDLAKKAINIESIWTSRLSGSIIAFRWEEVYTPAQNISLKESADYLSMQVAALCYGNINPINGFTSGTSSI